MLTIIIISVSPVIKRLPLFVVFIEIVLLSELLKLLRKLLGAVRRRWNVVEYRGRLLYFMVILLSGWVEINALIVSVAHKVLLVQIPVKSQQSIELICFVIRLLRMYF